MEKLQQTDLAIFLVFLDHSFVCKCKNFTFFLTDECANGTKLAILVNL